MRCCGAYGTSRSEFGLPVSQLFRPFLMSSILKFQKDHTHVQSSLKRLIWGKLVNPRIGHTWFNRNFGTLHSLRPGKTWDVGRCSYWVHQMLYSLVILICWTKYLPAFGTKSMFFFWTAIPKWYPNYSHFTWTIRARFSTEGGQMGTRYILLKKWVTLWGNTLDVYSMWLLNSISQCGF